MKHSIDSLTKFTAIALACLLIIGSSLLGNTQAALAAGTNPTAPTLGEAGRFVILASQRITTTGTTAISKGDLGITDQARSYYAGFTPTGSQGAFAELTNGLSYGTDDVNPSPFPYPLHYATLPVGAQWTTTGAMLTQSKTDLGTAYTYLANQTSPAPAAIPGTDPTELGGKTLYRGIYVSAVPVKIQAGDLTLDAQGDSSSVWIFQLGSTFTTGAPGGNIILANGAQAKNVYFQVAGNGTAGTVIGSVAGTHFYGNVLSWDQITVANGVNITGRLFSSTAQVTLIGDTITAPVQTSPTGIVLRVYGGYGGNGNPSNISPATVAPSTGTIYCNFTFTDAGSDYCVVSMQQGSGTVITGQQNTIASAENTTFSISPLSATAGYYNVTLSVAGIITTLTNAVYVDTSTPVVTIYTANTCWLATGSPQPSQTINWTATIPSIATENFAKVDILWNSTIIKEYTNVAQTTSGSYTWGPGSTPQLPSSTTTGTLYINAYSNAGTYVTGYSSSINVMGPNIVNPGVPTVPISVTCGQTASISFVVSGTSTTNFTYELWLNPGNGGNAQLITPGWMTPTSTSVTYSTWTVPSVSSTTATIYAIVKDCAGNQSTSTNSSSFTIICATQPTITITSPASGTVWYTGTTENITWTVNDPMSSATHICTVEYSLNDNTSGYWNSAILTQQGNSGGSYWATWSIPAGVASTTNCEIWIQSAATSTSPAGNGYSTTFYLTQLTTQPTLTIVSPLVGYSWNAGTTQSIGWTVNGTPSTTNMDYKIYLYYNGSPVADTSVNYAGTGLITSRINQAQCPSTACTYTWSIPTSLPSATYPGPFTIRLIASYYVGPGGQEQLPVQVDSQQFSLVATSGCASNTYYIPINPGWNLVSLQAMPLNSDISNVLSGISANVLSVYYFTGGNSGGWQYYIPNAGQGSLTSMSDGHAYWIQMSNSYTDNVSGSLLYTGRPCPCGGTTPLQAYVYPAGWNMVGFKSTVAQQVSTYLFGNCGTQYASPIQGYAGSPTGGAMDSLNCTDSMTPGSGYWIYFGVATGVSAGCK